jgi:hypothetical protein
MDTRFPPAVRPGRRQALASLLAGAVLVVSGHSPTTRAAKHKHKHKSHRTCLEPTVCPPPPDTCPARLCCVCNGANGGPAGCVIAPGPEGCVSRCAPGGVTQGLAGSGDTSTVACGVDGACHDIACPLL